MDNSGKLSKEEHDILQLLGQAHNMFLNLDVQHPSDVNEWVVKIHELQNIIGMRCAQRANQHILPIKKP